MIKNTCLPLMAKMGEKRIKLFVLLILLVCVVPFVSAQTNAKGQTEIQNETPEQHHRRVLFTQGNLMMSENFVDSALGTFQVLYSVDTTNCNVCYFLGELYLLTDTRKELALPYLKKASKHVIDKYIPDDPWEKNAPPNVYYYLARAQHLNYQFDTAINNLNKFKNLLPADDNRLKDIDYWVACCNNAKELMKSPVDCKIINMGDSINTIYPDYSPVITADEQEILFTSRRPSPIDSSKDINGNYYEDIWASYAKPDGSWTSAEDIGSPINTPGSEASLSLSPDGQQLILYREGEHGDGNIYISNLNGYQWSNPELIDTANQGEVNSSSLDPFASFSPDKKTLFFSSNRPGGFGGTDLYEIAIGSDGKWGQPVNLGQSVNTEYDEDAPFIHPDDSTLFFSSKGHNTMGGFDVFMATENANGQWDHVQNMGYPINTPDDDIYFKLSTDGRRGYYSSVRPEAYGRKDIYEVIFKKPLPVKPMAVLVGYITSRDNGGRLPNDITIVSSELTGGYSVTAHVNPRTGKFLQVLRPNQNYNITINTQGHRVFNQKFFLPSDSSYTSLSRAFFRTKIILGDTTNVFATRGTLLTAKAEGSMQGKMLLNNDPLEPLSVMPLKLIDEHGNVIQTVFTSNDGSFGFSHLPADHKYTIKADLSDSKLKHLKKLYMANAKGEIIRNYDESIKKTYLFHDLPVDLNSLPELEIAKPAVVATDEKVPAASVNAADFTRYFGYNTADVSANDEGFSKLIDIITNKAANGKVTISIEGSASKVPTTLFSSSNKTLAAGRAKAAKEAIMDALKTKSVDLSKVNIETSSAVLGPDYGHDAKDESKYQKFQYVKVYVR